MRVGEKMSAERRRAISQGMRRYCGEPRTPVQVARRKMYDQQIREEIARERKKQREKV